MCLKLLIVDDDPALRGMLSFSLENAGYEVLEADSRLQAIQVLSEMFFPVVILDMGMPPAENTADEGLAVLGWLNQHQPQSKVIVLTGQHPDSTAYQALKLGAFDFLEKPIAVQEILPAIKRAWLFYSQAQKRMLQEGVCAIQIESTLSEGVKAVRNSAEKKLLENVLAQTAFNVHETARRLGLKRENVYYLIKKYAIKRNDFE